MLHSIDSFVVEDARPILTLLCVAKRPLKVNELLDGIAVDCDAEFGRDRDRRFPSVEFILEICPGFIDIVPYLAREDSENSRRYLYSTESSEYGDDNCSESRSPSEPRMDIENEANTYDENESSEDEDSRASESSFPLEFCKDYDADNLTVQIAHYSVQEYLKSE